MPDVKLSKRQEAIVKFIGSFVDENGYPPNIREIRAACNISSTSVVNYNLNKLERAGLLARDREVSRGLRLVVDNQSSEKNLFRVPLVGRIVASEPVPVPASDFSIFGADESIEVTPDMCDPSDDLFALQVKGESMVDAMINDGDIVILKPAQAANNGDMVAVWLDDRDETTLKYFFKENNRIRLQPANPTMAPIYVDNPDALRIMGKVVMVIRQVGTAL